MKKYKYFFKSDLSRESIGVVKAKTENGAYLKAANKKNLSLPHFISLFAIEEIK